MASVGAQPNESTDEKRQTYGEAFVESLDRYLSSHGTYYGPMRAKELAKVVDEMFKDAVQWHD